MVSAFHNLTYMVSLTWTYVAGKRKQLIFVYVMFFTANVIICCEPIIIAQLVNSASISTARSLSISLAWSALYGLATLLFWAFHGPARILERRLAFFLYSSFVCDIYKKISEFPIAWHTNHHSGDTVSRVTRASRGLTNFSNTQSDIIRIATRFSVSIFSLCLFSPWISIISFLSTGVTLVALGFFDKKLGSLLNRIVEGDHHVSAGLSDYIGNMITIISLRLQSETVAEIKKRFSKMKVTFWDHSVVNEEKWGAINIFLTIIQALTIGGYIGIKIYRNESITPGAVVAIFQYLLMINSALFQASSTLEQLLFNYTEVSSVEDIFRQHKSVRELPVELGLNQWRDVNIKDLQFSYQDDTKSSTIRSLNVSFRRGQKIALIGASGSGKTTILTLIRGLSIPANAEISVDGRQCEGLAPLASISTLFLQQCEVFENTIRFNLTLGRDVPQDVLEWAVDVAELEPVLRNFPEGLDYDLRERGLNLSGGERQRISLARGLIASKDASILLLDEPTSSIDINTEARIFSKLFSSCHDKTFIVSLHRLHFLKLFDEVWVVKDGEIEERGPFQEALLKSEFLQGMWGQAEMESSQANS